MGIEGMIWANAINYFLYCICLIFIFKNIIFSQNEDFTHREYSFHRNLKWFKTKRNCNCCWLSDGFKKLEVDINLLNYSGNKIFKFWQNKFQYTTKPKN